MIGTNPAALNSATPNTKDPESQNTIGPDQNLQGKHGRSLRKGALVLICAATAAATLRALAASHSNSPPYNHNGRILTPDTANSTSCPEGTYRFNKASQLKRAKIGAGIGIGLIPGLALTSGVASVHLLTINQECAATTFMFLTGTFLVGSMASIPITAGILASTKSTKDGSCVKKNNNYNFGGSRG